MRTRVDSPEFTIRNSPFLDEVNEKMVRVEV